MSASNLKLSPTYIRKFARAVLKAAFAYLGGRERNAGDVTMFPMKTYLRYTWPIRLGAIGRCVALT
jgi:hypothetical protein